jgi:hypothetical protein
VRGRGGLFGRPLIDPEWLTRHPEVEAAPMLATSSVEIRRAPWIQDSSFASQLIFRFEYEPLLSAQPAACRKLNEFWCPVHWVHDLSPDLISLLKPVAVSISCFRVLVTVAFGRETRRQGFTNGECTLSISR